MFKVNFKKEYDTMDWNFIDDVIDKMGFHKRQMSYILECLKTSMVLILVNGTQDFNVDRRLKQGDPLSHFLFLLVA